MSELQLGDRVRLLTGALKGYVGVLDGEAHPDSPWKWVAHNLPGETMWGHAGNDEDFERVRS